MTPIEQRIAETDDVIARGIAERWEKTAEQRLTAERAEWRRREEENDKTIASLRFQLRGVETLIEVEQRHVSHDYEHVAGENYEDCSACRWHQILAGIRYALEHSK